ncbi:MAG: hypothetical protein IJU83_03255 [Clostridia bacterium]|nr:hypothetical protein [Clostridia bacterium]
MSEFKTAKPFYAFDLIIYCIIAVIAVCTLFFALIGTRGTSSDGLIFLVDNKIAAEYSFSTKKLTVKDEFSSRFSLTEEGLFFFPDEIDRSEYNLIVIDAEQKSATVKTATCFGHDCESQRVSAEGGFIFCAPHKLKIVPAGLKDPVSG